MEVILLKQSKLGKIGDIIEVKNGYARNCLLPRGEVLIATEQNKSNFEKRKEEIHVKKSHLFSVFDRIIEVFKERVFYFIENSSEDNKLYGSISNKKIAKILSNSISRELNSEDFRVNNFDIHLPKPIKSCGFYHATYKLSPEKELKFFISVGNTESDARKYADEYAASIYS